MSLAVLGRESPEELEKMVRGNFEGIEDKELEPVMFPPCGYTEDDLPFPSGSLAKEMTYVVPTADLHQMLIVFYIPPTLSAWRTKSHDYIVNLLGHECSTCLVAKLKREGLATALLAGADEDESCSRMQVSEDDVVETAITLILVGRV